jgi:hypothetical protein
MKGRLFDCFVLCLFLFLLTTVWKESIVLHADDGLYHAQTVLLQVTDRFRKNCVEGKMGEAVIPVASFFSEKLISGL